MSASIISYVKCCDEATKWKIYYHSGFNQFQITNCGGIPITYCPWCRVLLDTNLCED